jgi:hypothetical protein
MAFSRGGNFRKARARGVKNGYRSGLEEVTAKSLEDDGIEYEYETLKLKYLVPAIEHTYTPDFLIKSNGIIIETKGIFDSADRKKMLLVKEQHPELDIRMVFSNAHAPIYKGSPTTNSAWAEKHGFPWAHRSIPKEWLQERPRGSL